MRVTTNGYKVPESGDRSGGTTGWMKAIEFDLDRVNDHSHDGTDSAKLTSKALTRLSVSVSSTGFTAGSGGTCYQDVTAPAGMKIYDSELKVMKVISGTPVEVVHPTITRVNDFTITITLNEPLDLVVYF